MTVRELERLAVVETKVDAVVSDVAEIKGDVKALVRAERDNEGRRHAGSDIGVWVRFVLPWAVAVVGVAIAVVSFLFSVLD